ncbi:MAG: DNA internalization-related competence protein ComEC/Rec2 [Gammaproteobacteria bacterium]
MILFSLAMLCGVASLQTFAALPDPRWGWLALAALPMLRGAGGWRAGAGLVLGFAWALWRAGAVLTAELPLELEGETLQIEGRIAGLPRQRGDSLQFELDTARMLALGREWPGPARMRLSWYRTAPQLIPGEHWRLAVRVKRPYGFSNPGGFDYEGWLFQQRIRATGYVIGGRHNQRLAPAQGAWLERWRQVLERRLERALAGYPQAGVVTALAIGVQEGIASAQWRVFNATGTSHLISVSGLHIALVAGIGFVLGRWGWSLAGRGALYLPAPRAGALIGLLAAALYAALAGFSVPTQRSLVMVAVLMLGLLRDERLASAELLALALLAVLLIDPLAVMAAGFWLSFGAVAFIVYGMQARHGKPSLWWRIGRVHLVVALGLTPLLLMLFGQDPLIGPIANLVAVPYVSLLVLPLVLIGSACAGFAETFAAYCLQVAAILLDWLWIYLDWWSRFDTMLWQRPLPAGWAIAAGSVGVALLLMPRGMPARWLGLVWCLPLLVYTPQRPATGEIWFSLLDVGQGLAALVQTHRHALLFDAGARYSERFDAGRAVILPYLREQGIRALDTVIISHADNDHRGGWPGVREAVPVARVLTSAPALIEGPQVRPCRAGAHWEWDGVQLAILHPPAQAIGSENNQSCVLRVSNRDHAVLLTGDIEVEAERQLIEHYAGDLKAQILVAPHHGSHSSSSPEFIEAVAPAYVLFPVGYRNRYGFPAADIVARYTARGARVYNSAAEGMIRFEIGTAIAPPYRHRAFSRRYWHTRPIGP